MTQSVLINHMATEFTVEVADDGTTTVTTLDGSVLVTDLASRKNVVVDVNERLTVTSEQVLTKIDPESIDKWWIQSTDFPKKEILLFFSTLFLVTIVFVGLIALIIRKKTTAWGVTSLIFGIIGILVFIAPYFGLPLSVGAIWFSRIQKKKKHTNIMTAGFVLGIIGTILNVLLAIVYFMM